MDSSQKRIIYTNILSTLKTRTDALQKLIFDSQKSRPVRRGVFRTRIILGWPAHAHGPPRRRSAERMVVSGGGNFLVQGLKVPKKKFSEISSGQNCVLFITNVKLKMPNTFWHFYVKKTLLPWRNIWNPVSGRGLYPCLGFKPRTRRKRTTPEKQIQFFEKLCLFLVRVFSRFLVWEKSTKKPSRGGGFWQ